MGGVLENYLNVKYRDSYMQSVSIVYYFLCKVFFLGIISHLHENVSVSKRWLKGSSGQLGLKIFEVTLNVHRRMQCMAICPCTS